MKKLFLGFITGLALVSMAGMANAIIVDLPSSDNGYFTFQLDGSVSGPFDDNGNGLFVGEYGNTGGTAVEARAAYEFDMSTLSATAVSSASFSFEINDPMIPGMYGCFYYNGCPPLTDLSIFGYAGDGIVSLGDGDTGTLQASIDPLPSFGSLVTIDVTTFVSDLINNNDLFAGFNVRTGESSGGLRLYDGILTLDYSTTDPGPDPVPEPATMLLFGTGLMGLVGSRLRKKKK